MRVRVPSLVADSSLRVRGLATVAAALLLGACAGGAPAPEPEAQPVRMAPPDSAPATAADGLPAAFHEPFAAADVRARAVSYWMQCTPTVARLRAQGTFGPAARAPRAIVCLRTADGVPVGGVYEVDSAFTAIRRLQLVRLDGARPRFTEPLDTARLTHSVKLARDVSALVAPAWKRRNRPFSVVPFMPANDSLEAWVIPRATKARSYIAGGDVGYARGANGTPALMVDRTATWTQLNLAASGPLRIYSSVREVAAVSDLATARYYTELGRTVTVSTPLVESTLVPGLDPATGARLVWKHTPVKH
ncbi:hypothetical protein [Gemmatimonas sp.]